MESSHKKEPKVFYFDSNIYRLIKPSHPFYNKNLHEAMERIRDKGIDEIRYSDAHLLDLKDSKQEYIQDDLNIIERYANQNYLYRDVYTNQICFDSKGAVDAFNEHDYTVYNETIGNKIDVEKYLNNYLDNLEDTPETIPLKKQLRDSLIIMLNTKISDLNPNTELENISSEQRDMVDKLIPGYNNDMTVAEMMRSIAPGTQRLLTDKKAVHEFSNFITSLMNKEDYSFDEWQFEFNEKFKDTPYKKTFMEVVDSTLVNEQLNDVYLRFTKAYSMLHIFKVATEKKGKKSDYENIHHDAMHAFFAAYSDYLVTNDQGLQQKAYILYQLFGWKGPTILSSEEFINL